jgi:hypothetical protein
MRALPPSTHDPNFKPETERIELNRDVPINLWSSRYPDASDELGDWIAQHPRAAANWSQWAAENSVRMSTLVDWALTQRFEPIESLVADRSGWQEFLRLLHDDHDAFDELLDWIRRSPNAAEELASHPGGLQWAKEHIVEPKGHMPMGEHSVVAPR